MLAARPGGRVLDQLGNLGDRPGRQRGHDLHGSPAGRRSPASSHDKAGVGVQVATHKVYPGQRLGDGLVTGGRA